MVLLDDRALPGQILGSPEPEVLDERAARRSLRDQIAKLERDLAQAVGTAFPHILLDVPAGPSTGPRLLDLGELETVRDELAERLHRARLTLDRQGELQERARAELERMVADPRHYKFRKISAADVGDGFCGGYQSRPRYGLLGMLIGWWEVKVSSGCPLGRRRPAAPRST